MTKVLDIVDSSLQEIEEQLLDEFKRIRNTLSDAPYESVDRGIQNSLSGVMQELLHMLENSGDKTNLQLQTERHETLLARSSVIKQLLKAKIPTAFLHEVHKDVKSSRQRLENKVVARREEGKTTRESTTKSTGFLGSIKNMFSGDKSKQETLRNRIKITDQEAKEFGTVEMYLDNGIYSASRELAMLSSRLVDARTNEDPGELKSAETSQEKSTQNQPQGKATFESRDLSQRAPAPPPSNEGAIANTPEEIRRKLENRQSGSKTASTFEAKDVTQTISQFDKVQSTIEEDPEKIAPSPESIRQKLAARQQPSNMGKATFGSKDIEHAMPESHKPETPQAPKKDLSPPTGKAIFESKDLSNSGPTRKR